MHKGYKLSHADMKDEWEHPVSYRGGTRNLGLNDNSYGGRDRLRLSEEKRVIKIHP